VNPSGGSLFNPFPPLVVSETTIGSAEPSRGPLEPHPERSGSHLTLSAFPKPPMAEALLKTADVAVGLC